MKDLLKIDKAQILFHEAEIENNLTKFLFFFFDEFKSKPSNRFENQSSSSSNPSNLENRNCSLFLKA